MSKNPVQDQKSPSLLVTRRQFLPLLGATAASVSAARDVLAAAPSDASGKPSGAKTRFVYVGTYTAPGVPPGGTTRAPPSASMCSGWILAMAD